MYNLPEISEPVEKLEQLVRKEKDAQIQRRYHMLLLMKTGEAESRSGAARHLGSIAIPLPIGSSSMRKAALRSFVRLRSQARTPASSRFHQA